MRLEQRIIDQGQTSDRHETPQIRGEQQDSVHDYPGRGFVRRVLPFALAAGVGATYLLNTVDAGGSVRQIGQMVTNIIGR
jgi:hypothetical protein